MTFRLLAASGSTETGAWTAGSTTDNLYVDERRQYREIISTSYCYAAFQAHQDKHNDSCVSFRQTDNDRVYICLLESGVSISRERTPTISSHAVPYSDIVAVSLSDINHKNTPRSPLDIILSYLTQSSKNRKHKDRHSVSSDADSASVVIPSMGSSRRFIFAWQKKNTKMYSNGESLIQKKSKLHSAIQPATGKILGVELSNGVMGYYAVESNNANAIVSEIVLKRQNALKKATQIARQQPIYRKIAPF